MAEALFKVLKPLFLAFKSNELDQFDFVVVVPSFRLCPRVSVYNGPVEDARYCLLWAQNSLARLLTGMLINTNRIIAMGHSSEATLAGLLVSR
jgi:acetyl esterase/lipase